MNDKKIISTISVLIVLLFVIILNLAIEISHIINYNQQKENGNQRWLQVENRIIEMEEKVNTIMTI